MINYIEQLFDIVGLGNELDTKDISGYYMFEYSNFTEAKQLKLLRLIADERCNIMLSSYDIDTDVESYSNGYFDIDTQCYHSNITSNKSVSFYKIPFEQALAKLTLELIQEEKLDKEKVKEILQ